MSQQRAKIGRQAAENGPTRAEKHFTATWSICMNESTARILKSEYLKKLKEVVSEVKSTVAEEPTSNETTVNTLKIKQKASPFLLGVDLDVAVQEYIQSLRMVGGVVRREQNPTANFK